MEATRMLLGKIFERFVEKSPASVMIRGVLEKSLAPARIDALFEGTADQQYTRELLFSTLARLLSEVVLGVAPSVRAAYLEAEEKIPVSITAVYDKLQGVETDVSAELVRDSARQLRPLVRRLKGRTAKMLPGYPIRILDGNHLAGTEHRIEELRRLRAGALPGQALVVLDPDAMLVTEVLPCEDGHAQERSLLDDVLPMVQPGELWIDDRNFCTTNFLFGIHRRGGFFLTRQHASTLHWKTVGERKRVGRIETGMVFEQSVELYDPDYDETLRVRRITVLLDEPTRDGEMEIHLLTNLPRRAADAKRLALLYQKRWTIETMFQTLTVTLCCEINTLGYPKAALFGFCLALLAYNAVSLVKTALGAAYGTEQANEVSWHRLCTHLSRVYGGMTIAIPASAWRIFHRFTDDQLADLLRELAGKVDMAKFHKHPRGPKKPPPKKRSGAKIKHVATARILEKTLK
jgi:IS4 transposase